MADEHDMAELAISFAHMSRRLLAEDSVDSTLQAIVGHAVGRIDGCEEASIMVLNRKRHLDTVASTSEVGRESDHIQTKEQEGPCFDAIIHQQEAFRVADMGNDGRRWPRYAPQARAVGIGSMMGFLLFTDREILGALNFYSSRPNAFTERSEQVGWVFASHAAVAFAGARSQTQLRVAIETRQGIGEAMGIVMDRLKVTEDEAFDVLRRASQERNVKLRELARELVDTGEIPTPGDR